MPNKITWQGYDLTDPDEKIITWFQTRYGFAPSRIIRNGAITLAGPINPEMDTDQLDTKETKQ